MKHLIHYSNGQIETVDNVDSTLLRLLEKKVINYIYDIEKSILKAHTKDGIIDMPVPHVETEKKEKK